MKKIALVAVFVFASFFGIPKQSFAVVLFETGLATRFSWSTDFGTPASNWFLGYNGGPNGAIFSDIALTAAAVGQTFTVDATNPNFANYVAKATNGIDDMITGGMQWGSIDGAGNFTSPPIRWEYTALESLAITPNFFRGAGIWLPVFPVDLQGYHIDSFQLFLESFSSYSSPWIPGGITRDVNFTIRINGTPVPEPTSFVLFGLSLLGLAFKRFRS